MIILFFQVLIAIGSAQKIAESALSLEAVLD